jgi:hypothetical protein
MCAGLRLELPMAVPSAKNLKRYLMAQGFELYRTVGNHIMLAERVRDNLIMDAGVAAGFQPELTVRFVVKAQSSGFRGETAEQLFNRARELAQPGLERGYAEVETTAVPVADPGDRSRTLDIWYEVSFERRVSDLDELFTELRYALELGKTVTA